ncbi:formylglycine-generating enzyme family protein [Yersinia pekkanenii]|uniref:Serine/threonine-protein kinase pkn1 n=2 Tax=Yersinia pekkanenii TaxID=1288385 RepID=A0ABM9U0L4_9GAMM|nr:SUMF1/EgtB/PvdO family nonheme iron enzyme [Yersinia pekkanenii]CRY69138.1 Serine/threonine-protein kinase pkn1 [Yersinia pekkanenii]
MNKKIIIPVCGTVLIGAMLLAFKYQADKTDHQQIQQEALVKESLANMVFVTGGEFMMGDFGHRVGEYLPYSPDQDNKPEQKVTLDNFSISAYRVTWGQFNRYLEIQGRPKTKTYDRLIRLKDEVPAYFRSAGDNYPASVNWHDAKAYCQWLGNVVSKTIDLPTEAQWEYAARSSGKLLIFANNNNIFEPEKNFSYSKQPVGTYPPNPLGLYDMMGNGHDWVEDWYDENYYQQSPKHNPRGPEKGTNKVLRGSVGTQPFDNMTFIRSKRNLVDFEENGKSTYPPGYGFRCVVNDLKPL